MSKSLLFGVYAKLLVLEILLFGFIVLVNTVVDILALTII